MEVRPIDGNILQKWCEKIIDQACHPATVQIGEVFLDKVLSMPTLTPPNEPLTLEELRKMDGEPAWWDDGEGSCWGIISVDSAGMWGGIPFLRGRWRQVNFEYNIEERKMRIYRRPPEGEEDA
jgi:hypothetical protein